MNLGKTSLTRHSVIIPTFGRPDLLGRCLEALLRAAPPSWTWEAVVVDNSSSEIGPLNEALVDGIADSRIRYIHMPSLGLTAARHLGAESAAGDVLSFLDDDSLVESTWLTGVEEAFSQPDAVLVGGPTLPEYEKTPPDWLRYFWSNTDGVEWMGYLSLMDADDASRQIAPWLVFGCNFSIRRDVFFEAGGVHPDCMPRSLRMFYGNGESALSTRIEALGHSALYWPDCGIRHLVPASRMTTEYFCDRAYVFGLESSFSAIRAQHGLGPREGVPADTLPQVDAQQVEPEARPSLISRIKGRIHRSASRYPDADRAEEVQAAEPEDVTRLRERLAECRQRGFDEHQKAVGEDAELLAYVLRKDFLGDEAWKLIAERSGSQGDVRQK